VLSIQERRLRYVRAGYEPIPCAGKIPAAPGWQSINIDINTLTRWSDTYPRATNTGVRTRLSPAVDIDVRDSAVAGQIEDALRAHFPNAPLLVRVGLPPKRLIPCRCERPFKKIAVGFKSPDGVTHKVEVLGDGQQYIADGVHPDTGQAYTWRDDADLLSVTRDELPLLDEATARRFVTEASAIMTTAGWTRIGSDKANGKTGDKAGDLFNANKKGSSIYGRTALKGECAKIAGMAKDSGRNDALNIAAFNLFQLVAGGELDEEKDKVRERLFAAAEACGLVAEDGADSVHATIESGAKAGRGKHAKHLTRMASRANKPMRKPRTMMIS